MAHCTLCIGDTRFSPEGKPEGFQGDAAMVAEHQRQVHGQQPHPFVQRFLDRLKAKRTRGK